LKCDVKHVEQFPDINKLCNVASFWLYIGIILGAYPILHISRIRVKKKVVLKVGSTYKSIEESTVNKPYKKPKSMQ
jgi:hypothetical protein